MICLTGSSSALLAKHFPSPHHTNLYSPVLFLSAPVSWGAAYFLMRDDRSRTLAGRKSAHLGMSGSFSAGPWRSMPLVTNCTMTAGVFLLLKNDLGHASGTPRISSRLWRKTLWSFHIGLVINAAKSFWNVEKYTK